MRWDELLELTSDSPVFNTGFLSANSSPEYLRVQLSRWVRQKKLIKLKKGYYMLNKPFVKEFPDKFFIANIIKQPSYVSLESALSYYSLIPEYVHVITSVTTGRPQRIKNQIGTFIYKHIKSDLFFGYTKIKLEEEVFIAEREKALIDFFYFNKVGKEYIVELRLQNIEAVDFEKLKKYAMRTGKKKVIYAIKIIEEIFG